MLVCGIHSALIQTTAPSPGHSPTWFRQALSQLGLLLSREPRGRKLQMGVWTVTRLDESRWNFREQIKNALSAFPLFRRLLSDVFSSYPGLTTFYIGTRIWSGLQPTVFLYTSSYLIRKIEDAVISGHPDHMAILKALLIRLGFLAVMSGLTGIGRVLQPRLETGLANHFNIRLIRAQINLDLAASTDPTARGSSAWSAFDTLFSLAEGGVTLVSQLLMLTQNSLNNPVFAFMCLMRPLMTLSGSQSLWETPHIFYTENTAYKRMNAYIRMLSPSFRSEVIANELGDYLVDEYHKVSNLRGDLSDDPPMIQEIHQGSGAIYEFCMKIFRDMPIIYCGVVALTDPSSISVSQIAIWQQTGQSLDLAFQNISYLVYRFKDRSQDLAKLYKSLDVKATQTEGTITYPSDQREHIGMSFDLRDLSFQYPGSQTTIAALDKVSLSIKSGQLVVIVGANGSGKSTLVKILCRIYDPTSPPDSILVDGHPISDYHLSDLRRSTALLTQDHTLFPLSLGMNIGLGYVQKVGVAEAIHRAAELGGASHLIAKLNGGLETALDPEHRGNSHLLRTEDPENPLVSEFSKLPKPIQVSGGEKQRLIASRTFMRFESGRVNFVAVDEPTSALDAEGEADLFENLIKSNEGKTLVFVTHRFGPLTKRADLILCMKDGRLVESGKHSDLIHADGEYAKLYNIQANAFVEVQEVKPDIF